jgi:flagellar hook-associated protein 2
VDDYIRVNFADDSGDNSGQIRIRTNEANVPQTVAEGLQVTFAPGTLVVGQTFTVKVYKVAPPVQAATDSSVTLGSGPGAITIKNQSNSVNNLISGVTVNLLAADPSKDVQLTVSNETEQAKDVVLEFVDAFNGLMEYIDEQVQFDSETGLSGILLGDRSATSIQDGVRSAAVQAVAGVNSLMNRLGALGITANSQGRLDVNQSKLDDALAGRLSGVTFDDVRRLFALAGKSTNGGVQFVTGSVRTKESTTPYQVDISQAAERATMTGTNNVAASTVITGANNTLTIIVDGVLSSTITLATGTYTRDALAQELQAQINANSTLSGRKVAVSVNNNKLVITSDRYGLASEVKIGTGTALSPLGFVGTENDKGQDVVGKFIVNGKDEAAVGTGQFLVGNSTNANTADMQVRITLTSSQVVAGAEASVTVTRGVASRLDVTLNNLLDPVTGRTKIINDSFQDEVDDLDKAIEDQTELLESRQQALLRQFVALESLVSQLRTTGDFVTNQLLQIQGTKRP